MSEPSEKTQGQGSEVRMHNRGDPWSAIDDYYLTDALQVRTLAKIAEQLGRDVEEVRARVASLGLKLGRHNH